MGFHQLADFNVSGGAGCQLRHFEDARERGMKRICLPKAEGYFGAPAMHGLGGESKRSDTSSETMEPKL